GRWRCKNTMTLSELSTRLQSNCFNWGLTCMWQILAMESAMEIGICGSSGCLIMEYRLLKGLFFHGSTIRFFIVFMQPLTFIEKAGLISVWKFSIKRKKTVGLIILSVTQSLRIRLWN